MNRFLNSFVRFWDAPVLAFDHSIGHSFGCANPVDPTAGLHLGVPKNASPDAENAPSSHRIELRAAAFSETGNYRQINEDRCFANDAKKVLLIVDGMGGHRGGADASRIIVETIPQVLDGALQTESSQGLDETGIRETVAEAIHVAREEIVRFASTRPGFESMGATLVLAIAVDDKMYVASVGDCRAYCLRSGKLSQLTRDQTFVQQMVQSGQLSADEAKAHPWRHVVLNAVGVRSLEEPIEISATPLAAGDRLLLATDGLTDVLDHETLREALSQQAEPQAIAEELVRRALENDSKDNVSCIVADCAAEK